MIEPSLKKVYVQNGLIILVIFVMIVSSFGISRHLGYISLQVPFIYYLYVINTYWLFPRLNKGEIGPVHYTISLITFSLLGFLPCGALVRIASGWGLWAIAISAIVSIILTNLLTYYYLNSEINKKLIKKLEKDFTKKTSELRLLQAQVHPHFLFNTLNTIYGLAIRERANSTADSIYKLSDIMRYMTMVSDVERVYLKREIEFVRSYIDLQNERLVGSDHLKLNVDVVDCIDNTVIAPMLLIPFLENAYKYGIRLGSPSWITIKLELAESSLQLLVINSKHKGDLSESKETLGTGLLNVKNRLQILYPNMHELIVNNSEAEFYVFLRIELVN